MEKNIFQLKNSWLSQREKTEYKMLCAIMSFAINLYANTWILLTYTHIDTIKNICLKTKIPVYDQKTKKNILVYALTIKDWWYSQVFDICFKYVDEILFTELIEYKELWWMDWISLIKTKVWSIEYKELLDLWYALRVWLSVWDNFVDDCRDWKIDAKDYTNFVWTDFKHFFNEMKDLTDRTEKHLILDSLALNKEYQTIDKVNFKELEKVLYPTVYCVIPILTENK